MRHANTVQISNPNRPKPIRDLSPREKYSPIDWIESEIRAAEMRCKRDQYSPYSDEWRLLDRKMLCASDTARDCRESLFPTANDFQWINTKG